MNNLMKWLILPVAALALGSCGTQSIEGQLTAMQANSNEITTTLNEIQLAEGELQAAFEADIQRDASLRSLAKRNSQTYKNYSARQDLLEDLTSISEAFNDHVVKLEELAADAEATDNDQPQRQQEAAGEVITQSQLIADDVQGYINDYQANLDQEISYYSSLQADDADFKTYADGMKTINAGHKAAQANLTDLNQQLTALQATITAALEQEESEAAAVNLPKPALAHFSGLFTNHASQQIGGWTNGQ